MSYWSICIIGNQLTSLMKAVGAPPVGQCSMDRTPVELQVEHSEKQARMEIEVRYSGQRTQASGKSTFACVPAPRMPDHRTDQPRVFSESGAHVATRYGARDRGNYMISRSKTRHTEPVSFDDRGGRPVGGGVTVDEPQPNVRLSWGRVILVACVLTSL